MSVATETPFAGVFDQALQTYGEALKAGVKVQEQFAGYFADAFGKFVPTSEYQKKAKIFIDAAPAVQKNAEELLRLLEQNYRRSVELLKKACDAGTAAAAGDYQARLQALWESSLELVKENAQATTQASLRAVELFADFLRQNGVVTPPVYPKAPAK